MTTTVSGSEITFNDNSTQNTSAYGGGFAFRNRIINGAMVIDQRNAGASINPTDGQFSVDRFMIFRSVASKLTAQQNAGSVTPPAGFTNYLGITSSSAYTVTSSDYFIICHRIEGYNIADFAWGTANAKTITLSFWVRSSLTGTFGASIQNGLQTRAYPFTYTISSANTWEQKTITIAGDTSGTWTTINTEGLGLYISLGMGSTYSGTAGAWASSTYYSATGATSVVGTNGATFYITGVQLEKGSTATSFDYRPYGTELQLCQRYCLVNRGGDFKRYFISGNVGGTNAFPTVFFPVTMRSSPSLTISQASHFTFETYASATQTLTALVVNVASVDSMTVQASVASSLSGGGNVVGTNASASVTLSAEL